MRVGRRYIEVERDIALDLARVRVRVIERETEEFIESKQTTYWSRERDSIRSSQSKKCSSSVCGSAGLGVINPSTPWVILVLESTKECALSDTMPLHERKEGAPWCTCSLPQLAPVRSPS